MINKKYVIIIGIACVLIIFFIPFNIEYVPIMQEDCTIYPNGDFFTHYICITFEEKEEISCPGSDWCSGEPDTIFLTHKISYTSIMEYVFKIHPEPGISKYID